MTVRTFLYSFFTPWLPVLREEGVVPRWALTASLLLLAVLLVRALLREKVSLRLRYALWAAVLLRLLVPAQLPLSLPAAPARLAEGLPSPCLFGVFRPAVYLTPEVAADETIRTHVLAHELTHYVHGDHLWAVSRCLCLALHWYNPLVWLAAFLSKRDGELACDEGAVARLGEGERISYGKILVWLVARRTAPADLFSCSTAMTGGKKTVQQRIELLVKKPETVKTALFAAVSILTLCMVFVFAKGADTRSEYQKFMDRVESTTYQGFTTGHPPLWLKFEDGELTKLTTLPDIARTFGVDLPSDLEFFDESHARSLEYWYDHLIIPGGSGFTLYGRLHKGTESVLQWQEIGYVHLTEVDEVANGPMRRENTGGAEKALA